MRKIRQLSLIRPKRLYKSGNDGSGGYNGRCRRPAGQSGRFFAEAVVETVNGGHEFPVFSGGFIVVEECILQTVERLDFVENNAGGFVGDAGPVNLPQPLFRSADKLSGMGSRSRKKDKGGVVVLFSGGKAVSSQKNAEGSGNGVLLRRRIETASANSARILRNSS